MRSPPATVSSPTATLASSSAPKSDKTLVPSPVGPGEEKVGWRGYSLRENGTLRFARHLRFLRPPTGPRLARPAGRLRALNGTYSEPICWPRSLQSPLMSRVAVPLSPPCYHLFPS